MLAIDAITRKKIDDGADRVNKYWSEIILEEGGIQSRVGSLETKVDGVGGINERLRSAEQIITTDGITNLIKDEFYTKETIDNKLDDVGATDWRPTISDMQEQIEENQTEINKNKTEIETTKESVAEHTTALNNITSRVSTTESNITKINGDITSVTERISTAEQKITEDAITNTIKKNFYTKTESDTKSNEQMSTVNQTVDSWSAKITQNEKDIASLKLTDSSFEVAIGNKADSSNIISKINASTEGITISSSKINISGFVTFSALSTSGSTSINGGNITSGIIRGIKIISSTSDSVSRGELSGSGLNFYSPSKLAGTIFFDSNGEGTTQSAKDRFLITSKNSYVLKLLSAGNMSLQANSNIYLMGSIVQTNCQFSTDGKKITCGNIVCEGITNSSMTCSGAASVSGTLTVGGNVTCSNNFSGSSGQLKLSYESIYAPSGGTKGRYFLRLGNFLIQADNSYGILFTSSNGSWMPIMASEVFANGVKLTSDERLKTDIKYVNRDKQSINPMGLVSPNVNITTSDMHEFVETLPMVSYRLVDELNRNIDNTHYGFLAQEILYTKVGSELITVEKDEYGNEVEGAYLRYSQDKYISFICGALQEEIKQRKQLEQKVLELEQKLGDDK